ncbi:MAG: hypothetical protein FWG96_01645 [Methanomassiliicoccaceae archaeon]|nr:hypothetical protein [Methanomassiliicoccaceae archaeon]
MKLLTHAYLANIIIGELEKTGKLKIPDVKGSYSSGSLREPLSKEDKEEESKASKEETKSSGGGVSEKTEDKKVKSSEESGSKASEESKTEKAEDKTAKSAEESKTEKAEDKTAKSAEESKTEKAEDKTAKSAEESKTEKAEDKDSKSSRESGPKSQKKEEPPLFFPLKGGEYTPPDEVKNLILNKKEFFRGGVVYGTLLPDITFSMSVIRPSDSGIWLEYLFERLKTIPKGEERNEAYAFVLGVMVNFTADMFLRAYVSEYAGGWFDSYTGDRGKKHLLIDEYVERKISIYFTDDDKKISVPSKFVALCFADGQGIEDQIRNIKDKKRSEKVLAVYNGASLAQTRAQSSGASVIVADGYRAASNVLSYPEDIAKKQAEMVEWVKTWEKLAQDILNGESAAECIPADNVWLNDETLKKLIVAVYGPRRIESKIESDLEEAFKKKEGEEDEEPAEYKIYERISADLKGFGEEKDYPLGEEGKEFKAFSLALVASKFCLFGYKELNKYINRAEFAEDKCTYVLRKVKLAVTSDAKLIDSFPDGRTLCGLEISTKTRTAAYTTLLSGDFAKTGQAVIELPIPIPYEDITRFTLFNTSAFEWKISGFEIKDEEAGKVLGKYDAKKAEEEVKKEEEEKKKAEEQEKKKAEALGSVAQTSKTEKKKDETLSEEEKIEAQIREKLEAEKKASEALAKKLEGCSLVVSGTDHGADIDAAVVAEITKGTKDPLTIEIPHRLMSWLYSIDGKDSTEKPIPEKKPWEYDEYVIYRILTAGFRPTLLDEILSEKYDDAKKEPEKPSVKPSEEKPKEKKKADLSDIFDVAETPEGNMMNVTFEDAYVRMRDRILPKIKDAVPKELAESTDRVMSAVDDIMSKILVEAKDLMNKTMEKDDSEKSKKDEMDESKGKDPNADAMKKDDSEKSKKDEMDESKGKDPNADAMKKDDSEKSKKDEMDESKGKDPNADAMEKDDSEEPKKESLFDKLKKKAGMDESKDKDPNDEAMEKDDSEKSKKDEMDDSKDKDPNDETMEKDDSEKEDEDKKDSGDRSELSKDKKKDKEDEDEEEDSGLSKDKEDEDDDMDLSKDKKKDKDEDDDEDDDDDDDDMGLSKDKKKDKKKDKDDDDDEDDDDDDDMGLSKDKKKDKKKDKDDDDDEDDDDDDDDDDDMGLSKDKKKDKKKDKDEDDDKDDDDDDDDMGLSKDKKKDKKEDKKKDKENDDDKDDDDDDDDMDLSKDKKKDKKEDKKKDKENDDDDMDLSKDKKNSSKEESGLSKDKKKEDRI